MKKSRKLAWVVLLVVVIGLILSISPALHWWQWFRYESVIHSTEGSPFPGDPRPAQLVVLQKRERASWLPGDAYIIPPQVCSQCMKEEHHTCFGGWPTPYQIGIGDKSWILPPFWQCTCPSSDHKRIKR